MTDNEPVERLALTPSEIKFYNDEGYLVLPGLLSEPSAAALREEVMQIMETIGLGTTKLRQTGEYLRGSNLDRLVNSPNLQSIAAQLLGGASSVYLPFTAVKSTGGGAFHFHQDNQYTRHDGPSLNLWTALSPMTPENGCLMVCPRSHREGTLPSQQSPDQDGHKTITYDVTDFLPIRMRPGDCVAFTRLTVHGSGPNTTPESRVGYAVQFHRDDVRWSADNGETWHSAKDEPRFSVGPVEQITPPKGKLDGH